MSGSLCFRLQQDLYDITGQSFFCDSAPGTIFPDSVRKEFCTADFFFCETCLFSQYFLYDSSFFHLKAPYPPALVTHLPPAGRIHIL